VDRSSEENHGSGPKSADQVADEQALGAAFQASSAVKERDGSAAQCQVPFQGQEKNRKTLVKYAHAHGCNDGTKD